MAMFQVIIKNPGGAAVEIEDRGIFVPASGQIQLSEQFNMSAILDSDSLRAAVAAGTLVVNDGTSDLSTGDGTTFLTFVHRYHLEQHYYSKTDMATPGSAVIDWQNVQNKPAFGSPSWENPVQYRVTAISATAPASPVAEDVYILTTTQHYMKYNGATWDDLGAAAANDRVIKLDESDEAVYVFDGTDSWTDQGAPADNTGVVVEDDGDTRAAQYIYNGTSTSWVKIADADFQDHFNGGAGKHDATEIDVEGTYPNIPGGSANVEQLASNVNAKIGTMDTAISANAAAASAAQSTANTAASAAAAAQSDADTAQSTADAAGLAAAAAQSDIDGHLDGGANKHDASEVDVESSFTHIPGAPTNVEAALQQVDNKLGTVEAAIPTAFNTLDQAYDEGGAGAGRVITVDSGPVVFDTVGNAAGMQLTPKPTVPSTSLGGGQFHMGTDGIFYIYDSARNKWLSVNRGYFAFGGDRKIQNQMLNYYAGGVSSNNSGLRMLRNATIIGVSGQLNAAGSCDFRIRKNDVATNIATLNVNAAAGNIDVAMNVDLSVNDFLQCYLESTAYINYPMLIVEIAWRIV